MFNRKVRRILCAAVLCAWAYPSWVLSKWASDYLHEGAGRPQPGLVPVGGPVAEIRHGSRYEPLEWEFRLHNPTPEPITIRKVEAGCSCLVVSSDSGTVGPGETFPLRLKIKSFPMEQAESRQKVWVQTSAGKPLPLEVRVHLPLPEKAVFRPQVVYLDPLPGEERVARTVGVRVPKQCARPLAAAAVRKVHCPEVDVELTAQPPSDMYFEYQLKVSIDSTRKVAPDARLRLDTGCNPLEIGLRQSD